MLFHHGVAIRLRNSLTKLMPSVESSPDTWPHARHDSVTPLGEHMPIVMNFNKAAHDLFYMSSLKAYLTKGKD